MNSEFNIPLWLNPKIRIAVLLLSFFTSLFWILSFVINVYDFAIVGAIFELLWMFAVLLTIALPIVAFIGWMKEKFRLKSSYLVSILMLLLTVLVLSLS